MFQVGDISVPCSVTRASVVSVVAVVFECDVSLTLEHLNNRFFCEVISCAGVPDGSRRLPGCHTVCCARMCCLFL